MDYKLWKTKFFHTPRSLYAPDGLHTLKWYGGDEGGRDYAISYESADAFASACAHSGDPKPPPRSAVALVGRISFQDFAFQPDADWLPGRHPEPRFLGEASVLLQDPEPTVATLPFKQAWNSVAEICQCQLGVNVDVSMSKGLFASHHGVAALRLTHDFLVVSISLRPCHCCF